ncbi:tRNA-dihydrouridine(16) synthase [compost metagenome]
MQIALAPMEGLVDDILRDVLTRVGGIDWCVTEFIRINDRLLPPSAFLQLAPELEQGSRTRAGTPMRVQLLGSDPQCLAENAALACELGAPVIDLNFGCPAKTVNRSRGGAVLLKEPELMHRIVETVRRAVPQAIPLTAKMRLGYDSPDGSLDCARALADGGAAHVVVHARTKVDGYKPPAHWEWVARVAEAVPVPVFANGEVWTLADYLRCREISGVEDIMLGRGLVSRPDLARQIAAWRDGREVAEMPWTEVRLLLDDFWRQARRKLAPRYAPGRLKQWLGMLTRSYPEALELFAVARRESDCERLDRLLLGEALGELAA